jgi:hypothetical protein
MDSIKAFLSLCKLINTENDVSTDMLNVLIQKDQPVYIFDRAQQVQPSVAVQITEPEKLTQTDVAVLAIITEQSQWIVIMDGAKQVRGVIEPQRTEKLQIAAKMTIKPGELSAEDERKIPKIGGGVQVSVSFYGCRRHPEVARFALYDVGQPIPHCPVDGEVMVELEKKGESVDAKSHAQKYGKKKGWFSRLFSR